MQFPVKLKIRTKIIIIVMSISLLSLVAFLITTQLSLRKEMARSTGSLEQLEETAGNESEKQLIVQSHRYLNRLIQSEAYISNYFFKIIEYQLALVNDFMTGLYNTNVYYDKPEFRKLDATRENPDLVFYYSLAPGVEESRVMGEVKLLGSLHNLLRASLKEDKAKKILPQSVDGIFIGTASGIFFNMTWNAYYNKDYDARKRDWYLNARDNRTTGWTNPYEDDASKTHTVTCYQPVYDTGGKLRAVIGMDVTLEAMIDLIALHFKDVGDALVLDNSGNIINYTDLNSELLEFTGNSKNLKETSNKDLKTFYLSNINTQAESTGTKKIDFGSQSKLVVYAPIEVPDLKIIVISSMDEIKASVAKTRNSIQRASEILIYYSTRGFQNTLIIIILVFIIIVILTILILIKFSRLLTKPITLLTDKVEVIGNGNLDENLEINTGDELEILAGAFNKMTGDLKNYIASLKETTAAKERIESELQIAHKIQASMLPRIFPAFPTRKEFEIYASMNPAKDVGGDYFDFFLINENKLCFTVGDVSGKGIPGSLFMVISKTLIKMEATTGMPLDKVVCKVNNALCEDNDEMMFVTTIIFTIDLCTGQVDFVNAGHNPPLLKSAGPGRYEYLKPFHGFVLGARPDYPFKLETMQMEPGDVLFLYTDGVTEAMNGEKQQYSTARLQKKLSQLVEMDVTAIEKAISADIKEFVQDTPASDDITILAFRYNQKMQKGAAPES